MTPSFHEIHKVIDKAIKGGETPGDIITSLAVGIIGVINCLKVDEDIKKQLVKHACDMIIGEIKS